MSRTGCGGDSNVHFQGLGILGDTCRYAFVGSELPQAQQPNNHSTPSSAGYPVSRAIGTTGSTGNSRAAVAVHHERFLELSLDFGARILIVCRGQPSLVATDTAGSFAFFLLLRKYAALPEKLDERAHAWTSPQLHPTK